MRFGASLIDRKIRFGASLIDRKIRFGASLIDRKIRFGASLIDRKMRLGGPRPIGETAGIERFHSRHAYARHTGTAPLPVWPAHTHRHRLSRAGNRQLNAAVHRIALTQASNHPPARRFLGRRTEPPWDFWRVGLLVSNRLVVGLSGSVGRLELGGRDVAQVGV